MEELPQGMWEWAALHSGIPSVVPLADLSVEDGLALVSLLLHDKMDNNKQLRAQQNDLEDMMGEELHMGNI
jgi:hypothetical protein